MLGEGGKDSSHLIHISVVFCKKPCHFQLLSPAVGNNRVYKITPIWCRSFSEEIVHEKTKTFPFTRDFPFKTQPLKLHCVKKIVRKNNHSTTNNSSSPSASISEKKKSSVHAKPLF